MPFLFLHYLMLNQTNSFWDFYHLVSYMIHSNFFVTCFQSNVIFIFIFVLIRNFLEYRWSIRVFSCLLTISYHLIFSFIFNPKYFLKIYYFISLQNLIFFLNFLKFKFHFTLSSFFVFLPVDIFWCVSAYRVRDAAGVLRPGANLPPLLRPAGREVL